MEVKENNKSTSSMEEAFAKMKTDDDYMLGELVLIITFNFVIYFCSIYFLLFIKGVIKFVIAQA